MMYKKLVIKNNEWDWYLFLSIFLYQAIPSIYNSYSIYLIGNAVPDENSLSITSQWQFIQVIIEIIQESIVLPIFFYVGSSFKNADSKLIYKRINSSIKIVFFILTPFALLFYFQTENFVYFIDTPSEIVSTTVSYLKIKTGAIFFGVVNLALITIIESLRIKHVLIKLLVFKLILSVVFDSLFFGGYNYSFGFGVQGVAISNLLVEVLLFCIVIVYLRNQLNFKFFRGNFSSTIEEFKLFGKISLGILVESAVKNGAYFFMILAMINSLGVKEIGAYYLSIHLFWSFLLMPIIAFSDTLKVQIANTSNDKSRIKSLLKFGAVVGVVFTLLWILLIPFLDNILMFFSTDGELRNISKQIFMILLLPYAIIGINMILSSVFYGVGKTKYLAFKSIITNTAVYFSAFVLYKIEIWTPSLTGVLYLFAIGILVDTTLTLIYIRIVLREKSTTAKNVYI